MHSFGHTISDGVPRISRLMRDALNDFERALQDGDVVRASGLGGLK